ncbi:MAG: hypothetical protein DRP67_04480 [Candidatus Omnitrophota bacterium]|nr:MAG: hypothetical protein DRP67_04480 [Candidatus Omnitrophota bacterium]
MFFKLFIQIFGIFFIILLGVFARRLNILDSHSTSQASKIVVNFFYPSLILSSLLKNFSLDKLLKNFTLPAGTFLIMLTGYLTGLILKNFISFSSKEEENVFHFQSTINNYSFLPMPIVLMYWGEKGLSKLLFSTLGSEISMWSIGILALTGNKLTKRNFKNLITPPLLSIIFSILIITLRDSLKIHFPDTFSEIGKTFISIFDIVGKGTIPLALFVAGSKMAELRIKNIFSLKQLYLLIIRLILVPYLSILLISHLPFNISIKKILFVVCVMPCAVTSIILSEVYKEDVEFAASSVLITHIFSLFTIPLWFSILFK